MDISVIIPCYNEIENVKRIKNDFMPVIFDLAEKKSIEIIFVDDGCTDGTIKSLQEELGKITKENIWIKYIDNLGNWGLGKALRNGFSASTGNIVVTTDIDGTYEFKQIKDLLLCFSSDIDLVTASPYHPKGNVVGVPRYRLILSRGSSLIYRILVSSHIHTYTSLFRAYRRDVIEDVDFVSNGFMAGTELLVKCILKGYRVAEYPAVLNKRIYGVSKAKIVHTIFAHLRFQFSIFLHHLKLTDLVGINGQKDPHLIIRTKYSVNKNYIFPE